MELITTPSPSVLSSARENDSCPDISLRASYLTIATSRSARGSTVPCEPTAPLTSAEHSRTARAARRLATTPTTMPSTPAATPTAAITIVITISTIPITPGHGGAPRGGAPRGGEMRSRGPFGGRSFKASTGNGPLLRITRHALHALGKTRHRGRTGKDLAVIEADSAPGRPGPGRRRRTGGRGAVATSGRCRSPGAPCQPRPR